MNERIKELWDKSEPEVDTVPQVVITTEKTLEQFVELIVQECVNVIDLRYKGWDGVDLTPLVRSAMEECKVLTYDIKRRFGLE